MIGNNQKNSEIYKFVFIFLFISLTNDPSYVAISRISIFDVFKKFFVIKFKNISDEDLAIW